MLFKKKLLVLCLLFFVSFFTMAELPEAKPAFSPNQVIVKFNTKVKEKIECIKDTKDEISGKDVQDLLKTYNIELNADKLKQVCLGFNSKQKKYARLFDKNQSKEFLTKKEKKLVRRQNRAPEKVVVPDLSGIYVLTITPGENVKDVIAQLKRNPNVEYAEEDAIMHLDTTPDDPFYGDVNHDYQWYLNNTGNDYPASGRYALPPGTPDADIDASEAWNLTTGSDDVIVAVIDTGVDYTHRDLVGNMYVNDIEQNGTAGIDDDGNGYVDDVYGYDFNYRSSDPFDKFGHGTHCAGIIAAQGNNNTDIAGVCWHAQIMALKAGDEAGYILISKAIEAIYYAVEMGADILSNSWGGGISNNQALQDVINYAYSRGIVFVASAGNDGSNTPQYPAASDHVIAVAATDSDDARATFSNFGDWVDAAAPGVDILGLHAVGADLGKIYNDYLTIMSGTSMACPVVSGIAALLLSYNPALTVDQITNILRNTGDPIADGICASDKRVNAYLALCAAISSKGDVSLDRDVYCSSSLIAIALSDADLAGNPSQVVVLHTGQDSETVTLAASGTAGVFKGTIPAGSGTFVIQDGTLQLSGASYLWVEYNDQNDGNGNTNIAMDSALVDNAAPVIQNVNFLSNPVGPNPVISVTANENAIISVQYGISTPPMAYADSRFGSSVAVTLVKAQPEITYYFFIIATDKAGNRTIDNNQGAYYQFTTSALQAAVSVPSMYQTIQDAIDAAWDGTVITVAQGTYGHIDLKGKKITITGTDPDNWNTVAGTIIQVGGTTADDFCIRAINGESRDTVIRGVSLDAAGSNGGGFLSVASSPVLQKCRIVGYMAYGCYLIGGAPLIAGCIYDQCLCSIYSQVSHLEVRDCVISTTVYAFLMNNNTVDGKIENNILHNCNTAIQVNGLRNCPVINNIIYDCGIGIRMNEYTHLLVSGNTITGSTTAGIQIDGEAQQQFTYLGTSPVLTNSILWNNADDIINNSVYTTPVLSYCCIEDPDTGTGVIHSDPLFVDAVNKDFHITSQSPCYNAGDPNHENIPGETDIDGDDRINNGRIDIGADELPN